MTQLTLRGFDKELERRIRQLANEEGLSLNQAALKLLRRATGLESDTSTRRVDRIGTALDEHIGTWTSDEANELMAHVADFEVIDDEMWQ